MTTITTSVSTPLPFAAGIESLSDLDNQMERRKQERLLRRQERERKRLEDIQRSENESQQTAYQSTPVSKATSPQPSHTKSSEKLQKLDKELEEMRRMRQCRRTSIVQMGAEATMTSKLSINKEMPAQNSVSNTESLTKDQNKPDIMLSSEETVPLKSTPKKSEASRKTPSNKQGDILSKENKIVVGHNLTGKESPKDALHKDAKITTVTKVQPKKSVLSRYSIALENSDSKRIQESKPALPVRTTSSLAERAAIFSTVQQPEATAVVSKRKSASVLKFPSKQEGSNSDEDSSSISPSVCVSHRFGQSPQVIKRRSIMLEDQVATTGLKKDIVGALKIHPSLNIKPNNDVACVKERNLQNKQEQWHISSSPTEIKSTPIKRVTSKQQDLMNRESPPLKHAKKPTSPRVQKKRNGQQSQDSVQHSQNTLEDIAKIEPNKHELIREPENGAVEVEKTAKTGNEISNIGTQAVGMKCIKETKSVNLEEKKVNQLKKVATRPRVQNQPRELKIEEENEAKAIRERMLAKRKSSSALNINTNKSHINSRTVEESAALQFMEFRAKLGRQGTESFRNATERKIEERAGRKLKDTVHRWSTTDVQTTTPKQDKQGQIMSSKQDTTAKAQRPSLSVLPNSTKSTSVITTANQLELTLHAQPSPSALISNHNHIADKSQETQKVCEIQSNKQQCKDLNQVKSRVLSSEMRNSTKSVSYLKEAIAAAKSDDRIRKTEPSGRASLKKRAYSSSDLKAIRKAFEQANNTEQPISSQKSSSQENHAKATINVSAPVMKVHEVHQTSISNLQIVSPMPRKLSPEPIKLANKEAHSSKVELQASISKQENQTWSTRKALPSKLDLMHLKLEKPKERLEIAKEKNNQRREVHDAENGGSAFCNDISMTPDDYHKLELACNEVQSRSMNRSPTGSDDSSLLDTPKEGKKVSFSPTITTFCLDPEEEYDDSNQDYFKTKGSSRKAGVYSDIEAISELPPPMEPLHQYNRQQTSISNDDYSFTDEKRDTSAFWKAFSSEMTNVSHMYSERESGGSMLPPPDHPDNYYSNSKKQKSQPSWVKKSLEGGRPEPTPAAPSLWRSSGIWDNLFGRKNNSDNL